jgi:hypothetical protein
MDIYKAILELREEKKRLDRAIATLEQAGEQRPRRRSWNADARRAAAERMKQYWDHRKQKGALNGAPSRHNVKPPSTESA